MSQSYAEKYLLPDDEKCNYLVELLERTSCGMELFYINCDSKRDKTYGQLINHSSLPLMLYLGLMLLQKVNWRSYFVHNVTLKVVRRYYGTMGKIIMV